VMGQEYLPNRLGLAAGVTVGAAIGVGGLAAAALGALADETSLVTAMWVIAAVPFFALVVAWTLPPTEHDRKLQAEKHESPAAAGPSVPVMDRH
jgi:FSR family fosmidomycin resistance protein-like MFS transporter